MGKLPQLSALDQARLIECYERHRLSVYRQCLGYGGGSAGWAEDVTQEVFLKLMERLPHLERTTDLGGWLYRVTCHLALRRLKRDRSFVGKVARLWSSGADDLAPSAEVLFEGREAALAATRALAALPPNERVVLTMKLLEGKNQNAIAEALGLSAGYVSKLVTRGLQRLRALGWEVPDGEE